MIEIGAASAGLNLAKGLYQALEFIRGIRNSDVIAAYFRHDGTRIEGSDKIEIEVHRENDKPAIWWYSVRPLQDYVFVRQPTVESCAHELVGQVAGEPSPDARYWRWVAPVLPGRIYGGEAVNLKVDFLVFGYKPKALIKYFSTK